MNLCCLLQVLLGFGTKFTWIFIIKTFAINLPLQPYALDHHLGFYIMAFLGAAQFLQLGYFGLDFTSFCNCMLQSWPIAGFGDFLLFVFYILHCRQQCWETANSLKVYFSIPELSTGWLLTYSIINSAKLSKQCSARLKYSVEIQLG